MSDEEKKLLLDIRQAIAHIDIHLESQRDFEAFADNITKRRAVERELEIIGEAINNLLKRNAAFPITSARQIVNLRNRVIHAYDDVDEIILWQVLVNHVPILLQEVERLLLQE